MGISNAWRAAALISISSVSSLLAGEDDGNAPQHFLAVPEVGKEVLLLDDSGKTVKTWKSERPNAGGARLLADGSLLHVVSMPMDVTFQGGGVKGGGLEILDRTGKTKWRFWNSVRRHISCGDVLQLPNGNILTSVLEWKTREEAEKAGRDPALLDEKGLWVPGVMEVQPVGEFGGMIVWQWSLWDHLYQQRSSALPNYHRPQPKEGCIDINLGKKNKGRRWLVPYQMDFHERSGLIALTFREVGEVWLVRHRSVSPKDPMDKTGNILARWGGELKAPADKPLPRLVGALWGPEQDHPRLTVHGVDGRLYSLEGADAQSMEFKVRALEGMRLEYQSVAGKAAQKAHGTSLVPGGGHIIATGFQGMIVRFGADGQIRWTHQNISGLSQYVVIEHPGEEVCCGAIPEPVKPGAVKSAQVVKKDPSQKAAPLGRVMIVPPAHSKTLLKL